MRSSSPRLRGPCVNRVIDLPEKVQPESRTHNPRSARDQSDHQICEYAVGTKNRLVIFDTVSAYCGSATSFFHTG